MVIGETARLNLRHLRESDAEFIYKLLNEPSWKVFIGDKNIGSLEDAKAYIRDNPVAMYKRLGFGLFLVSQKQTNIPIGLCGLIKRDGLEHVDLGFAFSSEYWGCGFAAEAASSVLEYANTQHGFTKILAITLPNNQACIKLLKRLGFDYLKPFNLPSDPEVLALYSIELGSPLP